ncbi:hypothetical protein NQZ68_008748 [Dissostichus eleginoides]|nr:hypothetical protein NQZ68_008748 [Dissostichus eleginoides]
MGLWNLAWSPLCQQLLHPSLSLLFFFYLYISLPSSITMRLGMSSFITDILSTSTNICFCWNEVQVESKLLLHLHHPAAVLWSKAAAAQGSGGRLGL